MNLGLIGGIAGTVIGLAGGAIGTYYSIKHTDGPKERAFMVRMARWVWFLLVVFLGLLLLLPSPYRFLLWIPYSLILPLGITKINRKQAEIRRVEKLQRLPEVN